MEDLGIIDNFSRIFGSYIDSGFGLLSSETAWLAGILIAIDVTLAGLFWAMDENAQVIPSLLKKVLYVGAFALLINNYAYLAGVLLDSFAGLGLMATGTSLTAEDLFRPGHIARTGFEAAWPLLDTIGDLSGLTRFFENFLIIAVLLFSWIVVIVSFFILAIQLFVTLIEFKLVTLAGFILVPFALWNKTSFLAERVLGGVISSGVKVMVLAVIVGIGSLVFADFAEALSENEATLSGALSLVLGALSLLGLSIFSPAVAAGLVSGAPQLGAGAAVGAAATAVGGLMAGSGAAALAFKGAAAGSLSAVKAGASVAGQASTAYRIGRATSSGGVGSGLKTVGSSLAGSMKEGALKPVRNIQESFDHGRLKAWAGAGTPAEKISPHQTAGPSGAGDENLAEPRWAKNFRKGQNFRSFGRMGLQALREGDRSASALSLPINQSDKEG